MVNKTKRSSAVSAISEVEWGRERADHLGYASEEERIRKRGLEDWEMVERMTEVSDAKIPYWFFALFAVLLLVAVGLTFPFWGVRPGYERSWFDWGIPAGVAWVISTSALIYYFVDYRHSQRAKKAMAAEAAAKQVNENSDPRGSTKPVATK